MNYRRTLLGCGIGLALATGAAQAGCPDALYEEQLFKQTGHFCPETERVMRAVEESHQNLYDIEVKIYGRQAVLECRSRMSNHSPQYNWCLEANRGRR